MSFPSSIDSIPQPTSTSLTNNPGAAEVSTAQTNAIVAIETKLGTGASTPTSGTVLTGNGTGTSTWGGTTGSGNVVLATSPTLVTPALGTPASGVATNLTGTASGLTAGSVTTNANLTGPITSSGNTTSIASQTGTGSKFVVDTSPTLVTPNLGTPSAAVLTNATGLPYAGLLSTIFSSQVASYTNTGTAGGTVHWINLGGIKIAWVLGATGNSGGWETVSLATVGFTNPPMVVANTTESLTTPGWVEVAQYSPTATGAPQTTGFSFLCRQSTGTNTSAVINAFCIGI